AKGPGQVDEIVSFLQLRKTEKMITPAGPGDMISVGGKGYLVVEKEVRVRNPGNSSRAWRNNNPGNLTADSTAPEAWSYGCYPNKNTEGRFVIFPSYAAGVAGAKMWASKRTGKTIAEYFGGYAAKGKGVEATNDPSGYAKFVSGKIGLKPSDLMQKVF